MTPRIVGRGTHLPEDVLTNEDVAALADPAALGRFTEANAWCRQRTEELRMNGERDADAARLARRVFAEFVERRVGIRERRVIDRAAILAGRPGRRDLLASDLGARAAVLALADAGLASTDLDLIVCGTSTPNAIFPATAVEIQHALGAHAAFGFDVMAACSSFVYAFVSAVAHLKAGMARRALVVTTEYFSAVVDWADPSTSYFAGDGAAAVVLEADGLRSPATGPSFVDALCVSRYSDAIRTGLGGTRAFLASLPSPSPSRVEPGEDGYRFFHQHGPRVYRDVLPFVETTVRRLLDRNGIAPERIARWWVHQASLPMLDGLFTRLLGGRPDPRVMPIVLDRLGNMSSCGAGYCLATDRGLAPGEQAVLLAFGGGYTVGASLLEGR